MSRRPGARVPLHEQMYTVIRARIETREWGKGHQLPTEWQLAEEFGVSRGTTRQAITRLVNEGLLDRSAGRGTFVKGGRPLAYRVGDLLGFAHRITAGGRIPSSRLVRTEVVQRHEMFGFAEGVRKLLLIERVRLADDEPVALERIYLPWPRFAGLADMDLEKVGVYDTLEADFGVEIELGDFDLTIADLDAEQAGLLNEAPDAAVFLMQGSVTDHQASVIAGVQSYYRRDTFSFQFAMTRREHGGPAQEPPNPVLALRPAGS
ncbi:GntR family transcriptional regulator [Kineosporia babensis]|uniref:GntR family transcriptional regulator n=1 Tax=Kineosporia babensis TaxID=499548 RepID=A0A9X1NJV2_9ACTN|nr:GntR family transcriptional regulator [Kineosporia babensis]MCD5314899.1 GntR family transcriptional regulator [Kineosporia babensis]